MVAFRRTEVALEEIERTEVVALVIEETEMTSATKETSTGKGNNLQETGIPEVTIQEEVATTEVEEDSDKEIIT